MKKKSIRGRHIFATVLDYFIFFVSIEGIRALFQTLRIELVWYSVLVVTSMFLLVFKDFLFGNASLGKFLMRLRIVNYETYEKPTPAEIAKRALRFCIFFYHKAYRALKPTSEGNRDSWSNTIVVDAREMKKT